MISSTAIFAASDIEATLTYYKDVLGFESTWTWGNPPVFGSASKGGVTITFELQPELAKLVRGHLHGIKVEDADTLYRFHVDNGARIVSEIENKPWGTREYVAEDLNGYHLRFSGPLVNETPKSLPFPEGSAVEQRKPSADEYAAIAGAEFGYAATATDLLECTWNGVVARSPSGDVIGVLRIMRDAPGWFSIWDVAVTPKWQAHGIGSAMMRAALETIREVSPGATVYLFTYRHGFYERLGFTKEAVTMRRL